MTPGIWSLVSSVSARWHQQELSAKNISGATVIGNKRHVGSFGTFDRVLRQAGEDMAYDAPLRSPLSYAKPVHLDWMPGPHKVTGQPLDVAIEGEGLFSIQTSAGVRLTRNGHFTVNANHQLVDDSGSPVLGEGGPITVPQGGGTVAIQPDGTVALDTQAIGKIQLVTVPDPQKLVAEGGALFAAGDMATSPVKNAKLTVGALEASNVDIPQEMVGMINNQRYFDMAIHTVQMQDESIGRGIQDLSAI
jgi:flagellar basal-body rod protein FlgF